MLTVPLSKIIWSCEAIAAMSLSLASITSSTPLPLNVRSPQDTMLPSTLLFPVNSIVACE